MNRRAGLGVDEMRNLSELPSTHQVQQNLPVKLQAWCTSHRVRAMICLERNCRSRPQCQSRRNPFPGAEGGVTKCLNGKRELEIWRFNSRPYIPMTLYSHRKFHCENLFHVLGHATQLLDLFHFSMLRNFEDHCRLRRKRRESIVTIE